MSELEGTRRCSALLDRGLGTHTQSHDAIRAMCSEEPRSCPRVAQSAIMTAPLKTGQHAAGGAADGGASGRDVTPAGSTPGAAPQQDDGRLSPACSSPVVRILSPESSRDLPPPSAHSSWQLLPPAGAEDEAAPAAAPGAAEPPLSCGSSWGELA